MRAVDEYGLIVADGHHVVVAVAVAHDFGRGFAEGWAVDVGHDAEVHESQARVVAVEVGGGVFAVHAFDVFDVGPGHHGSG